MAEQETMDERETEQVMFERSNGSKICRRKLIFQKCSQEGCQWKHDDIKANEVPPLCRDFFLRKSSCPRGDSCPLLHVLLGNSLSQTALKEAQISMEQPVRTAVPPGVENGDMYQKNASRQLRSAAMASLSVARDEGRGVSKTPEVQSSELSGGGVPLTNYIDPPQTEKSINPNVTAGKLCGSAITNTITKDTTANVAHIPAYPTRGGSFRNGQTNHSNDRRGDPPNMNHNQLARDDFVNHGPNETYTNPNRYGVLQQEKKEIPRTPLHQNDVMPQRRVTNHDSHSQASTNHLYKANYQHRTNRPNESPNDSYYDNSDFREYANRGMGQNQAAYNNATSHTPSNPRSSHQAFSPGPPNRVNFGLKDGGVSINSPYYAEYAPQNRNSLGSINSPASSLQGSFTQGMGDNFGGGNRKAPESITQRPFNQGMRGRGGDPGNLIHQIMVDQIRMGGISRGRGYTRARGSHHGSDGRGFSRGYNNSRSRPEPQDYQKPVLSNVNIPQGVGYPGEQHGTPSIMNGNQLWNNRPSHSGGAHTQHTTPSTGFLQHNDNRGMNLAIYTPTRNDTSTNMGYMGNQVHADQALATRSIQNTQFSSTGIGRNTTSYGGSNEGGAKLQTNQNFQSGYSSSGVNTMRGPMLVNGMGSTPQGRSLPPEPQIPTMPRQMLMERGHCPLDNIGQSRPNQHVRTPGWEARHDINHQVTPRQNGARTEVQRQDSQFYPTIYDNRANTAPANTVPPDHRLESSYTSIKAGPSSGSPYRPDNRQANQNKYSANSYNGSGSNGRLEFNGHSQYPEAYRQNVQDSCEELHGIFSYSPSESSGGSYRSRTTGRYTPEPDFSDLPIRYSPEPNIDRSALRLYYNKKREDTWKDGNQGNPFTDPEKPSKKSLNNVSPTKEKSAAKDHRSPPPPPPESRPSSSPPSSSPPLSPPSPLPPPQSQLSPPSPPTPPPSPPSPPPQSLPPPSPSPSSPSPSSPSSPSPQSPPPQSPPQQFPPPSPPPPPPPPPRARATAPNRLVEKQVAKATPPPTPPAPTTAPTIATISVIVSVTNPAPNSNSFKLVKYHQAARATPPPRTPGVSFGNKPPQKNSTTWPTKPGREPIPPCWSAKQEKAPIQPFRPAKPETESVHCWICKECHKPDACPIGSESIEKVKPKQERIRADSFGEWDYQGIIKSWSDDEAIEDTKRLQAPKKGKGTVKRAQKTQMARNSQDQDDSGGVSIRPFLKAEAAQPTKPVPKGKGKKRTPGGVALNEKTERVELVPEDPIEVTKFDGPKSVMVRADGNHIGKYLDECAGIRRLPQDVLEMVFSYLADGLMPEDQMETKNVHIGSSFRFDASFTVTRYRRLEAVLRTCHYWRQLGQQIVCKYVNLNKFQNFKRFVRTISEDEELGKMVRAIKVNIHGGASYMAHDRRLLKHELSEMPKVSELAQLFAQMMESCPELQVLSVSMYGAIKGFNLVLSKFPMMREMQIKDDSSKGVVASNLWKNLNNYPNLENFRIFHSQENGATSFDNLKISPKFYPPRGAGLRYLKALTMERAPELSDRILTIFCQKLVNLTTLVVVDCKLVTSGGFSYAIQKIPNPGQITRLIYYVWVDPFGKPTQDEMLPTKCHLCTTIREYCTNVSYLCWKPYRICGSFWKDSNFRSLERCRIEPMVYKDCDKNIELRDHSSFIEAYKQAREEERLPKLKEDRVVFDFYF